MNYNAKNSLLLQLLKLFGAYIVSQLLIVFIFAAAVSGDEIPEKYDSAYGYYCNTAGFCG